MPKPLTNDQQKSTEKPASYGIVNVHKFRRRITESHDSPARSFTPLIPARSPLHFFYRSLKSGSKKNRFSICKTVHCAHTAVIIGSSIQYQFRIIYWGIFMFYWSPDFGPIKLFFSNFMLRKILFFLFGAFKMGWVG